MKRPVLMSAAAALLLAGCATDPNDPNRNTQQGLLIGSGLGAMIGAISGDDPEERRRRAAAGAVIGGLAGGVTGSILDRQEAELREQLASDGVVINNTGDELIVSFVDDLLFAVDSAQVLPSQRNQLVALANNLRRYPDSIVRVTGHTDNTGEAAYNQQLSGRRAGAVSNVLVGAGVASSRIAASGQGEAQPVASNLTPEGRALNRRVDVVIVPTSA